MESTIERLHAWVDGRVQGVGFRFFVQKCAIELEITGWVRNLYDGRVEVVAEGTHLNLLKLLAQLHRGPGSAMVSDVDADWESASGEFTSFRVRYTAI
ncbi:MAG: acylphosphatase [Anaerolineaceae bacterium]|nr:acylphosphatase [Anaerolineaceae bacterium]